MLRPRNPSKVIRETDSMKSSIREMHSNWDTNKKLTNMRLMEANKKEDLAYVRMLTSHRHHLLCEMDSNYDRGVATLRQFRKNVWMKNKVAKDDIPDLYSHFAFDAPTMLVSKIDLVLAAVFEYDLHARITSNVRAKTGSNYLSYDALISQELYYEEEVFSDKSKGVVIVRPISDLSHSLLQLVDMTKPKSRERYKDFEAVIASNLADSDCSTTNELLQAHHSS